MKVLFHVQHLLGIGHVRRASLIAAALTEAGAEVTVAYGGFPVPGLGFAGARVARLPPARAADAGFSVVLDGTGQPIDDDWKARRTAALLAVFEASQPDAVILETYPFGRRKFRFELLPLLRAARAKGGMLIASSVRDILVAKQDPAKESDMAALARRWLDLVLVHGDPDLIRFDATFPYAARIADLIHYTGYVVPTAAGDAAGTDGADGAGGVAGEVIVSVGGGAVGDALLRCALAARPLTPLKDAVWRFLLGPDVPAATADALRAAAGAPGAGGARVVVEPARPDFPILLRRCRLSISQAGYNTAMEVLAAGCRSVLVPFAGAGESEQTVRARLLAERGAIRMVEEPALSPESLARAVTAAQADPAPPAMDLKIDGAATSAKLIFDGIRHPRARGTVE